MADNSFSLEIGETFTRLADAHVNKNKIELSVLSEGETTPNFFKSEDDKTLELQSDVVSKLYSVSKLKKKNVNVVIPDSFTFSQILEMPKLKEKELLSAIRYQADEFIPMPIEETSLDLEILQENSKTKKLLILIVAAPKKIVTRIEKMLDIAGLNADTLENELTGTGRLVSTFMKPFLKPENATVIINLGHSSTSFYLVDNSNLITLMSRNIKMGYELFLKDLTINLNVDEKKAREILKLIGLAKNASYDFELILSPVVRELSAEIEKFITSSKDRFSLSIDNVYLTGHSHLIQFFDQKLHASLSLPVIYFPLSSFLADNQLSKAYLPDISTYLSVIAGTI